MWFKSIIGRSRASLAGPRMRDNECRDGQCRLRSSGAMTRRQLDAALAKIRGDVRVKNHRYTTPAGVLPSVTTVLKQLDKPALVFWASKVQSEACEEAVVTWLGEPEAERGDVLRRLQRVRRAHKDFSRRAADMGTEGHALVQYEMKRRLGVDARKPELDHPREASMICAAVLEWIKAEDVEPVAAEMPVWAGKAGMAGTLDLLGFRRDVLTVFDWKSSDKGRVYREAHLQNHAYRAALREHGVGAEGLVLGVPRDGQGDLNPVPVPWSEQTYRAFLGLLDVHRWSEVQG